MSSTLKPVNRAMEQGQQTLTYWPTLSEQEQAFVAAYVESTYNLREAAREVGLSEGRCRTLLIDPNVKKAVKEVQEAIGGIDFMNEKWVKSQMLRLFPMVMGDEPVPLVDNTGCEIQVRKFNPEMAFKIMEYVAPKNTKVEHEVKVTQITRRVVRPNEIKEVQGEVVPESPEALDAESLVMTTVAATVEPSDV